VCVRSAVYVITDTLRVREIADKKQYDATTAESCANRVPAM